ncbi:MAG: GNAT family N-acetyltransferase [Chloroflexi bacterium]|nr:GNAT family N-acetyltransferase [Chloroflexota bacterium]MYC47981.1 GNAT family N-acetyltransferase [Chloroflexota bacterium]
MRHGREGGRDTAAPSPPTGNSTLLIRKGRRSDVDRAAPLLYESSEPMAAAAFGLGDTRCALRAVERMYLLRGNLFAWDACDVAEIDGRVVGVLASCRIGEMRGRNLATIVPLLRSLGPLRSLALLRRGLIPTGLGPRSMVPRALRRRGEPPMVNLAASSGHYVNALAVADKYRRLGIARRLVGRAHAAASAEAPGSMVVNVFEFNAAARDFYRGLGYREVRRFEPENPEFTGTSAAILTLQADLPGPKGRPALS